MPSLFPKKPKQNPYMNPHHPSHTPLPKKPCPPPPPSSTNNLLASARISAGRDPHTGRLATHPSISPYIRASTSSSTSTSTTTISPSDRNPTTSSDTSSTDTHTSLAALHQVEAEERTGYQNRALAHPRRMGSTYELFAQEARRRAEVEARIRAARGGVEYYAPERRVQEFYSGRLED